MTGEEFYLWMRDRRLNMKKVADLLGVHRHTIERVVRRDEVPVIYRYFMSAYSMGIPPYGGWAPPTPPAVRETRKSEKPEQKPQANKDSLWDQLR